MTPSSTALLYSLAFLASSLCQARAAHRSARLLPDPVGLSSRAFWPRCRARMILLIMATCEG